MTDFKQHYSNLHNDELIELALSRQLVPEAQQALKEELKKRGINDLSSHKTAIVNEISAAENVRQKRLSHHRKVIGWRTKAFYVFGLISIIYGLYGMFIQSPPNTDRFIFTLLGVVVVIFAWFGSIIDKLWAKYVLYRIPPR